MAVQGGFGLDLKITISSTPTTVVGLLSGDMPAQSKVIVRKVPHDAANGYAEKIDTGVKDMEPFTARLQWDVSEATHAAILAAFDGTSAVPCSIDDPGSAESIAFSSHVQKVGRVSPAEDGYEADVVFEPTGAPTIT